MPGAPTASGLPSFPAATTVATPASAAASIAAARGSSSQKAWLAPLPRLRFAAAMRGPESWSSSTCSRALIWSDAKLRMQGDCAGLGPQAAPLRRVKT